MKVFKRYIEQDWNDDIFPDWLSWGLIPFIVLLLAYITPACVEVFFK